MGVSFTILCRSFSPSWGGKDGKNGRKQTHTKLVTYISKYSNKLCVAGDRGNGLCVNSACVLPICIHERMCVYSKRKTEQLTISLYTYVYACRERKSIMCF